MNPKALRVSSIALASLAVISLSVFDPPIARAGETGGQSTSGFPGRCHTEIIDYATAAAICADENGGSWTVVLNCSDDGGKTWTWRYGQRRTVGASWGYCQGNERVQSASFNTYSS